MISAMRPWHVNVVHLGSERGLRARDQRRPGAYGGANYMNAIKAYVNRLHAHGLYAEVSLMWAAPGTPAGLDHPPILDQDHSADALDGDRERVQGRSEHVLRAAVGAARHQLGVLENGGSSCSSATRRSGCRRRSTPIRATGATNVVTASGIDWANNLQQWLAEQAGGSVEPVDGRAARVRRQHLLHAELPERVHGPGRGEVPAGVRRVRREL